MGAASAQVDRPPAKKKGKKKKKGPVDLSALPPEERARREEQRRKQQLALRLQAEGKVYKKRKVLRADGDLGPNKRPRRDRGNQGGGGRAHDKGPGGGYAKPEAEDDLAKVKDKVQCVVIPIYWNKKDRKQEKFAVVDLCRTVKQMLLEAGVYVWLDINEDLLPGQRMRYWEEQGVKVRVEVGPNDAAKKECIVARVTGLAGEVAQKNKHKVDDDLPKVVLKALGEAPAHKARELAKEKGEKESSAKKKAAGADAEEGDAAAPGKAKKKKKKKSDEEETDGAEVDAKGTPGTEKKKKKKKKKEKGAEAD